MGEDVDDTHTESADCNNPDDKCDCKNYYKNDGSGTYIIEASCGSNTEKTELDHQPNGGKCTTEKK